MKDEIFDATEDVWPLAKAPNKTSAAHKLLSCQYFFLALINGFKNPKESYELLIQFCQAPISFFDHILPQKLLL